MLISARYLPSVFATCNAAAPYAVEERLVSGDTTWIAIRACGAEWSWLTPQEAAAIGRQWAERYSAQSDACGFEIADRERS